MVELDELEPEGVFIRVRWACELVPGDRST